MISYLLALLVGVLLSGLWIYSSRYYPKWEKEIFGYSLVLAGVIYVFFGFIESTAPSSMIPEALVRVGFIALALVGLKGSLLALGFGWICHGIWDVSAPVVVDVSYVPWYLEPTCVGFDFIVGVYLIMRARDRFPSNNGTGVGSA